jgi:hypothetical protein
MEKLGRVQYQRGRPYERVYKTRFYLKEEDNLYGDGYKLYYWLEIPIRCAYETIAAAPYYQSFAYQPETGIIECLNVNIFHNHSIYINFRNG